MSNEHATPPWGDDDIVLIRNSDRQELDIYGCLRRIAAMSYEEKLRIWKQKQARAKAIETRRAERFRQIERLKTGDVQTRIANYLRSRQGEWVNITGISRELKISWGVVHYHLCQLNHHVEHFSRGNRQQHLVRIPAIFTTEESPIPSSQSLSLPTRRSGIEPSQTEQVLSHLVLGEWVSTAKLPLSKMQRNQAVFYLRKRGYIIKAKVEHLDKSTNSFLRLVSIPNPEQGKGEK